MNYILSATLVIFMSFTGLFGAHADDASSMDQFAGLVNPAIEDFHGSIAPADIQAKADKGNPAYQIFVGLFYAYGINGYTQDLNKADVLIRENVLKIDGPLGLETKQGRVRIFTLAQAAYLYGEQGPISDPKFFDEISRATMENIDIKQFDKEGALNEKTKGMFLFVKANKYLTGDGVPKDFQRGKALLHEAADDYNTMQADLVLSIYYFQAEFGFEKDYKKALHYMTKMVELHNNYSVHGLISELYREGGYGVARDEQKAFEHAQAYYEKSADNNAASMLAEYYEQGIGVDVDLLKAKALYEKTRPYKESLKAIERINTQLAAPPK